jgi:elongator complex protein 3
MELEDYCKVTNDLINDPDMDKIINMTREIFTSDAFSQNITTSDGIKRAMKLLSKKYHITPRISKVLFAYRKLALDKEIIYNQEIQKLLLTKSNRGENGVMVVTVFTSPTPKTKSGVQDFSCKWNCHFCPKEPGQPRSYLLNEPAVLRANANNFISREQFWDRTRSYILMGHPIDKIELLISGGTFSSYPEEYIEEFIRDQFYAANVVYDKITGRELREPMTLAEEQLYNQNESMVKIIGITIETRPDCINSPTLKELRRLGVTRVQIGQQHTDDDILRYINRGCLTKHGKRAIKLLKEEGFKIDFHLMPDLPAPPKFKNQLIYEEESLLDYIEQNCPKLNQSDIQMLINDHDVFMYETIKEFPQLITEQLNMIDADYKMFINVIFNEDLQVDQWKIYPCETVPWTQIESWYKEGIYKPYGEIINPDGMTPLFKLIINIKKFIKEWIRINRIIRDIPNTYILGGNQNVSMRNDISIHMNRKHIICRCIRCREVKSKSVNIDNFYINVQQYNSSGGIEYFISWIDESNILLGFLRLRINSHSDNSQNKIFGELSECGLIRELHIYGQVLNHQSSNIGNGIQHMGLGKRLVAKAEELAIKHKLTKISVISGVGVRNYYQKLGYTPTSMYVDNDGNTKEAFGHFLIKNLVRTDENLVRTDENLVRTDENLVIPDKNSRQIINNNILNIIIKMLNIIIPILIVLMYPMIIPTMIFMIFMCVWPVFIFIIYEKYLF